jgi:hypothetical protein
MDAKTVIKESLATAEMIGLAYLNDLTDGNLMQRPHAQCNHINWQIGHLVASEHRMLQSVPRAQMPALPPGFAEMYDRKNATCDDVSCFTTKATLLQTYREQRAGTLASLERASPEDLDHATGIDYAPTVGSIFSLQGAHWLMHCGQWVVIRRQAGLPVVI